MKKLLFLIIAFCIQKAVNAQQPFIYSIIADSVKVTNSCDTAELIIENYTKNIPGFLFNKGHGRTEFKRGLLNVNEGIYLLGADTLDVNKILWPYYKQGGNSFGTTAVLGAQDAFPLTFIQNGVERARINSNGHWLFKTIEDKGYSVQVNGKLFAANGIVQYRNVNITPVGAASGEVRINIGDNTVTGRRAIAIGSGIMVNGNDTLAVGIGIGNRVNGGIGILGSTDNGIAVGLGSYAHEGSVAIGIESVTTDKHQFVCGGPDHGDSTNVISDVYFGTGAQRSTWVGPTVGHGHSYVLNGSGAFGVNYTGGNTAIAGGKGTGAATPGNIIFSIAGVTASGDSLQELSEKAWITGSTGHFLINTIIDNGSWLNVNGTTLISDTLTMPNVISKHDTSDYKPVVVDGNGNIFKMNGWNLSQITRKPVNDVGYSVINSDYLIAYTSLTAPRTVTLPAATDMNNHIVIVKDESGAAGNYSITVNVTAGGTIDGATSKIINNNYGLVTVWSNGLQWLTK